MNEFPRPEARCAQSVRGPCLCEIISPRTLALHVLRNSACEYFSGGSSHTRMPKLIVPIGTASSLSRRHFIKYSALSATVLGVAPSFLRGQNLNSKINVACIGVGGKGGGDTDSAFNLGGNIVALCDVDTNTLDVKNKS